MSQLEATIKHFETQPEHMMVQLAGDEFKPFMGVIICTCASDIVNNLKLLNTADAKDRYNAIWKDIKGLIPSWLNANDKEGFTEMCEKLATLILLNLIVFDHPLPIVVDKAALEKAGVTV